MTTERGFSGQTLLDRGSKFYIAGHRGLAGSAIWRHLESEGFTNLVGKSSSELDLRRREDVFDFFESEKPQFVVIAAAKVGGILANAQYPVDFLSENLQIQVNLMDAANKHEVNNLLFLGSSCIYPRDAAQPIAEESLLTGHLERTNDAYAIAKIAGIMHVQATRRQFGRSWISAMPTNLYGPEDNFSVNGSHVLPAMIRRYDDAARRPLEQVVNWGTGLPRREFLHVDDLASACLFLLEHYDDDSHVNVGVGQDVSIRELAGIIGRAAGYTGTVEWDTTKPDGTSQKLLDVSRLTSAGWKAKISLEDGIESTLDWYRKHQEEARL